MCEAHFIREAYFICRRHISLVPKGTNFIEKTSSFDEVFSTKSVLTGTRKAHIVRFGEPLLRTG